VRLKTQFLNGLLWMVNPIHSVEQEAALQDIEAGKGDDGAYVADVLQRTQEP
jgi:hypothetical protein